MSSATPPHSKAKRPNHTWVIAIILTCGAGVSVQTQLNSQLGTDLDSALAATAINHGSALVAALLFALPLRSIPRGVSNIRNAKEPLRFWWFLGGGMGAIGVFAVYLLTPTVGIVASTVALIAGSLLGSAIADHWGLGPGGRRPITLPRGLGILLCIAAALLGAGESFLNGVSIAIIVVLCAGAGIALQQAANGQLTHISGEVLSVSAYNFMSSGFVVGLALLCLPLLRPGDLSSLPVWAPLGGLIGFFVGAVLSLGVRLVGVLTAMLAIAAGQTVAALVIGSLWPLNGRIPGVLSAIGAILALAAVALSGIRTRVPPSVLAPQQIASLDRTDSL